MVVNGEPNRYLCILFFIQVLSTMPLTSTSIACRDKSNTFMHGNTYIFHRHRNRTCRYVAAPAANMRVPVVIIIIISLLFTSYTRDDHSRVLGWLLLLLGSALPDSSRRWKEERRIYFGHGSSSMDIIYTRNGASQPPAWRVASRRCVPAFKAMRIFTTCSGLHFVVTRIWGRLFSRHLSKVKREGW